METSQGTQKSGLVLRFRLKVKLVAVEYPTGMT